MVAGGDRNHPKQASHSGRWWHGALHYFQCPRVNVRKQFANTSQEQRQTLASPVWLVRSCVCLSAPVTSFGSYLFSQKKKNSSLAGVKGYIKRVPAIGFEQEQCICDWLAGLRNLVLHLHPISLVEDVSIFSLGKSIGTRIFYTRIRFYWKFHRV